MLNQYQFSRVNSIPFKGIRNIELWGGNTDGRDEGRSGSSSGIMIKVCEVLKSWFGIVLKFAKSI